MCLSDLDLSPHHPLLRGAAAAWPACQKYGKSTYPLLHPVIFHSRLVHPMPSSIFSLSDRIIYTQTAHAYLFLWYHAFTNRISIPLDPLTDNQPPLTIGLTLAPTLSCVYFSFFGLLFTYIYFYCLSFIRNHFSTVFLILST